MATKNMQELADVVTGLPSNLENLHLTFVLPDLMARPLSRATMLTTFAAGGSCSAPNLAIGNAKASGSCSTNVSSQH
jgi:hypothetical protein